MYFWNIFLNQFLLNHDDGCKRINYISAVTVQIEYSESLAVFLFCLFRNLKKHFSKIEEMYKNNGVGLAANQIGSSNKIFVIDVSPNNVCANNKLHCLKISLSVIASSENQ